MIDKILNLFRTKEKTVEAQSFSYEASKMQQGESYKSEKRIGCVSCDGYYKIRDGRYGTFAGCSNYPRCKSSIPLFKYVANYVEKYGINIYRWERQCYKCGNVTHVYSYYLNYDLSDMDEVFNSWGNVGLGDFGYIDKILSEQISSIKLQYSRTTNSRYIANSCEHCSALQGRNYIVDDPHEIMQSLWHDHTMDQYLFKTINVDNVSALKPDLIRIFDPENDSEE